MARRRRRNRKPTRLHTPKHPRLVIGCRPASAYFKLDGAGRIYMDLCTIHAENDNPMKNLIRTTSGGIYARQCVFSAKGQFNLMLIWQDGWDTFQNNQNFQQCYYAGPVTLAAHPWLAPRSQQWWLNTIDPNAAFAQPAKFIGPDGSNLRPMPGSALDTARSSRPLIELITLADIDGNPYNQHYGASQSPCRADVNRDGLVSPADFNAWIAAFNRGC